MHIKEKGMLCVLVSWAIYLSCLSPNIDSNNMIYAIGHIHAYDNTLFNGNIYMKDGVVSPRFFLDNFFAFLMKLCGGKWQDVAVPFIYVTVFVLSIATTVLVFRLTNYWHMFFTAVISLFLALNVSSQAGGFETFRRTNATTIGIGMAYAFAVLAIAFAEGEKKNFNASWIALTCALLFHVHEGLYGFAVVFILFLGDVISKKKIELKRNYCFIFYFITLMVVVIPNMLTDVLNISNEEFVWIYADFRHPHHLVPSTWDKKEIIESLVTVLLPGVLRLEQLRLTAKTKTNEFLREFILFILAWNGVYILMYIGTEKMNIVPITVMFLSKFLKYVAVISLIWYITMALDYFKGNDFFIGFLVLSIPLIVHRWGILFGGGAGLCASAYIYYKYRTKVQSDVNVKENPLLVGGLGLIYMLFLLTGLSGRALVIVGLITALICIEMFFDLTGKKVFRFMVFNLAAVLFIGCFYGMLYKYSEGEVRLISSTDALINSSGNDIYQLAQRFREKTDPAESYIAELKWKDSIGWFQLISERNCYVIKKVVPSSKAMVKEWYERCQKTEELLDKDIGEIIRIMNEANCEYVLTQTDRSEKLETSDRFQRFVECEGDSYRVYRLIE